MFCLPLLEAEGYAAAHGANKRRMAEVAIGWRLGLFCGKKRFKVGVGWAVSQDKVGAGGGCARGESEGPHVDEGAAIAEVRGGGLHERRGVKRNGTGEVLARDVF